MKKKKNNTAGDREGIVEVNKEFYAYLWRLIHRLEGELVQRGVSIRELDMMSEEERKR